MFFQEHRVNPVNFWQISIIVLNFLLVSSCSSLPGQPDWYNKAPQQDGILTGYGDGQSLADARQMAFSAIAQQIEVNINSQIALVRQFEENELTTKSREVTQLRVNKSLKNVKTVKQLQLGDLYFVALQLDRRPAKVILEHKLDEKGYLKRDFKGSPFIVKSPLITSLNTSSEGARLSVSLQRREREWYLTLSDILQPLDSLNNVINWDVYPGKSHPIEIVDRNENRLRAGERFQIQLELPKTTQYLTIINIYSDGRLSVLLDNQPVTAQKVIFPNNNELFLEAMPVYPGQADRDTYLALGSIEKIDTTPFPKSTDSIESGESAYVLDKFIQWLDQQKLNSLSSLYIEITP